MTDHETAVREAATALHEAIVAARRSGFVVAWPNYAEGLPGIAISETAKATVTKIDGSPVGREADGVDPNTSNDPAKFEQGTAKKRK